MFWKVLIFIWEKSYDETFKDLVKEHEKKEEREKSMKKSCKVSNSRVKCLKNKACLPYSAKLYFLK